MQALFNILTTRPTLLKWLFLVVLSTGSSLFRDAAYSGAFRTEQVYTAEARQTAGITISLFRSATSVRASVKAGINRFSLAFLFQFARATNTRYKLLAVIFLSILYKLRQINSQLYCRILHLPVPVFSRS
ncbi:hypothetical protein ASG33_04330 [Dyadobacter sp. Leaf189]|nr:hypothetical protein ASG33_04330 [Dyadobacter sp. Leaf189]